MDVDEDDDFYGEEDDGQREVEEEIKPEDKPNAEVNDEQDDEDLEEGEEEGEAEGSDDSDIDIITERKDGSKATPPKHARYNTIQNINQRNVANDTTSKPPTAQEKESPAKGTTAATAADLPGLSISKIDVNAKPIYAPASKPITQINIDEDLNENEKPWRRPGTDISDYFNYGFDEFTWALYASKQEALRSEYDGDKIAQNSKKMFEDMNMMMAMGGGMPGMMPGTGTGMEGIPPEMQAMMQQMMAQGMDPSQMDPNMFAGMQVAQAGSGGTGAQAGQGFGQGQNAQMGGYGFDQGMEGRNRGGNFGRGRGGRRNW